jgi:hypothetical protein
MTHLGKPLFSGVDTDPEPLPAAQLSPGATIRNPLGQQPWVLDLLDVGDPDAEGMVALTAVQDTVRVAADWPVHLYTAADAVLEAGVLAAELDRHRTGTDAPADAGPDDGGAA